MLINEIDKVMFDFVVVVVDRNSIKGNETKDKINVKTFHKY